jgi:hypothetical protein
MTVLIFGSVHGAPGVTTTSMLAAGCLSGSAVVAEADLDGGVLAARHGISREPGLLSLAAADNGPEVWRDHAQLAAGVPVLVGPDDPELARRLWARAGRDLTERLAASAARVVVDAGRLLPVEEHAPLLQAASLVAVVVLPVREQLVALAHQLPRVRAGTASHTDIAVIVVGSGPYQPEDITGQLGVKRAHQDGALACHDRLPVPGRQQLHGGTQADDAWGADEDHLEGFV